MKIGGASWRFVLRVRVTPKSLRVLRVRKNRGNAFTLTVASHCVAATREVDPRHSTRDLRLEQRPQKDLCVPCERKTLKLLVKAYRG